MLVPLAGCFGGGLPLPLAPPGEELVPDERRLVELADALRAAPTQEARLTLTANALSASGVAPVADAKVPGAGGQYRVGRDAQTIAGLITGRVPVWRDSLVVISAPRNGVADLALIEASRMLVARAAYTQRPERSVLVVLGDDVASGARVWDASRVVAVLRIGPTGADSLGGQAVQRIDAATDASRLASTIYSVLSEVSSPPSPYVR